jgi:predicted RNA binding protein YcfA (HicA-like mRNA interferase family)
MGKLEKLIETILLGGADANMDFDDLCSVLLELGFSKRQKGSHHIFSKSGVEELVNLQRDGSKAKPYQVRQVRTVIQRYSLWSRP